MQKDELCFLGTQLIAICWFGSFCFFNNVLRILFAKNELLLLVTLYTYLYLNKTISDKDQRGLSTVLYIGTVRRCSVCAVRMSWGNRYKQRCLCTEVDEYIN